MKKRNPKKIQKWLAKYPSLNELRTEFPEQWIAVQQAISQAAQDRDVTTLQQGMIPPKKASKELPPELENYICQRMFQLVVKNQGLSDVTGVKHGKVSFNWFNGYIIQKLLFLDDLERKPASLFWFRLFWPLIWQKNYLMPLVEPKGIYCFYSRAFINELVKIIGSQSCLEIAAGDGTLSVFLQDQGVRITATDNRSWDHSIEYPKSVINMDAKKALKTYNPEVVICSWPPANNNFEADVFKTNTVNTYIVIGSQLKSASGNWNSYKDQNLFSFEEDKHLSSLIIPPELSSAVYIFRRKAK